MDLRVLPSRARLKLLASPVRLSGAGAGVELRGAPAYGAHARGLPRAYAAVAPRARMIKMGKFKGK